MLENMEFDAPIGFIYHRDVFGIARKTFAFAPVSKNSEGKFDKYLMVSVKKLGRDVNDKEIARTYVLAKLIKYYKIYSGMKDNVRTSNTVKVSFSKKGVKVITHPELKKMRSDAAKNNVAAEKINLLKQDLISSKYFTKEIYW